MNTMIQQILGRKKKYQQRSILKLLYKVEIVSNFFLIRV